MRRTVLTCVLSTLAATVFSMTAQAQGQTSTTKPQAKPAPAKPAPAKVTLPAAIDAAFKKAYPNATIKHVSKEAGEDAEKGKTVYEVESIDNGMARDLVYRPDGTVVEYEETVAEASVPAPVVSAIKAKYPNATLGRCEKLFKGGTTNYEIALKGAKVSSVTLTPDGKWVSPK
jgi:hypothetical protein